MFQLLYLLPRTVLTPQQVHKISQRHSNSLPQSHVLSGSIPPRQCRPLKCRSSILYPVHSGAVTHDEHRFNLLQPSEQSHRSLSSSEVMGLTVPKLLIRALRWGWIGTNTTHGINSSLEISH